MIEELSCRLDFLRGNDRPEPDRGIAANWHRLRHWHEWRRPEAGSTVFLLTLQKQTEFTSVYDRITARRGRAEVAAIHQTQGTSGANAVESPPLTPDQSAMVEKAREESVADAWLSPFGQSKGHTVLDLREEDYLKLLDWTGRCFVDGKEGALPENLPPILESMDLLL